MESLTMVANASVDCSDALDLGFSLLYFTVPLNLVTVLKSVLVIVTVSRTSSLHTNTNILIASMSVADLIHGTVYIFLGKSGRSIYNLGVPDRRVVTLFVFGEWHSTLTVCVYHIAIIAIDRYVLIAHPFYYMKHVTKRCVTVAILFVWGVGLVSLFLPVVAYMDDKYHQRCIMLYPPVEIYSLGTGQYLAGCLAVLVCYFRIASLAFSHKIAANARRLDYDHNTNCFFTNNLTAALKSVKFFALMFGVFFSCTLPAVIVAGMNSRLNTVPTYVFIPVMLLFPVYSVISFCIYFNMNKNLSQATRKIFSDLKSRMCKRTIGV